MVREYEDLTGGIGEAIYYRSVRYKTKEMFKELPFEIFLMDGWHKVYDFSMYGISLMAPKYLSLSANEEYKVELRLDEQIIFEGTAQVVRITHKPRYLQIAMQLNQGFLDIPNLVDLYEGMLFSKNLESYQSIRDLVPKEYREIIEEAVNFIQYHRQCVSRAELHMKSRDLHDQEHLLNLSKEALRTMKEPWAKICARAAEIVTPYMQSINIVKAMKRYTEQMLTPLLLEAPVAKRGYEKPLGYPGDFLMMLQGYRNEFEGETAFGKAVHKMFVEQPIGEGGRARKNYLRDMLLREHTKAVEKNGDNTHFRVLNLGCGASQEIREFIEARRFWKGTIEWVLIDQDDRALAYAQHQLVRAVAETGCHGIVRCLHLSFTRILNTPKFFHYFLNQDLVYSSGLFDYLPTQKAQELVRLLSELVVPEGLVCVGNVLGPTKNFWLAEFMSDWTLIYRNEDEMYELGEYVQSISDVSVERDPTSFFYFLLARKHKSDG